MNKKYILTLVIGLMIGCLYSNARSLSNSIVNNSNMLGKSTESEETLGLRSIEDPEFEWTQFKDKTSFALLDKKGLVVASKTDNGIVCSTTEVSLNLEDDSFCFGMILNGKVSKDKGIGLLFDYSNNRNYKCIMFTKDNFTYYSVEGGERSIVKQGLVKTGKGNILIPCIIRNYGQTYIFLNGQEVTKLKNLKLNEPVFGVAVEGKNMVSCSNFIFEILPSDTDEEMSTTGN